MNSATSPSTGIVFHWPTILEMGLRAVGLVYVLVAFLTAAIAVGEIEDLSDSTQDVIDDSDRLHDQYSFIPDTPDLIIQSLVVAGFLIALAVVVMFYAGMAIVVRLVNPILINQYIVFFLVTDIIISGILALIFLVSGALAGRYSALWDEWVDVADESSDEYDTFVNIRGALGAACAFSVLEALVLIGIAGWLLVSIVFKWHLPPQKETTGQYA